MFAKFFWEKRSGKSLGSVLTGWYTVLELEIEGRSYQVGIAVKFPLRYGLVRVTLVRVTLGQHGNPNHLPLSTPAEILGWGPALYSAGPRILGIPAMLMSSQMAKSPEICWRLS